MGRGSRWPKRSLRHVFPLQGERQASPRLDGTYVGGDGQRIQFSTDGRAVVNGEAAAWRIEDGTLWLSTSRAQYEGALDTDAAYLIGTDGAGVGGRAELELRFEPHSP
jgi:hypothetical protein